MSTYGAPITSYSDPTESKKTAVSTNITAKYVGQHSRVDNNRVQTQSHFPESPSGCVATRSDPGVTAKTSTTRGVRSSPSLGFRATQRQSYFVSLQSWEGVVLETSYTSFRARLIDKTQTSPDEEAEFSVAEVSEEDRELVSLGGVFYWHIGYNDSPSGQRTRVSIIRFRRLPSWSKEELEAARRRADELGELIGWK